MRRRLVVAVVFFAALVVAAPAAGQYLDSYGRAAGMSCPRSSVGGYADKMVIPAAAAVPSLVSWGWSADATDPATANVGFTATTTADCAVMMSFKIPPKVASFTIGPSSPEGVNHSTRKDISLATYGGKTYTEIKYSIWRGAVEVVPWTLIDGASVRVPLFGDPQESAGS